MSLGLSERTKRDSKGFAIRTPENRELALKLWDEWLAVAYSDNPKELTDEEVQFINENSSISDRRNSQEYKKQIAWYFNNFDNHDSELFKHWRETMDLLDKHYRGMKLTDEEIKKYDNCYRSANDALLDLEKYKKGGLRRNNFYSSVKEEFGSYLKYNKKEVAYG
ncbi:MAG: hypothetical protein LBQ34_04930 [Alphaproteobacteria bacterium]|jgi:hypothetical protein|nr:hypothetical protein [Alphaproteobacteria bacterium]